MTLMCQTRRPRLAQRLSILHQDQHFLRERGASPPESLQQEVESCPRLLFTSTKSHSPTPGVMRFQVSLSGIVCVFQVGHDKAMSI